MIHAMSLRQSNSCYDTRIDIMQRFIRLFGRVSIKCLVADREFVGHEWLKWLNDIMYLGCLVKHYRNTL